MSKFLRRSLLIFIIKIFQTIVFVFIVISTTFRSICPPAFFRCLSNLGTFWTTSFIETMGVACSDSVCHIRVQVLSIPVYYLPVVKIEPATFRWLSSQKLREPTPITVTPCVLLDNSEWIFGYYKVNVLTLARITTIMYDSLPVLVLIFRFQFFFYLAFLIIGSHIVFNSSSF